MEMQVRGWREERVAWTTDTTGRAMPVVTGLTKDRDGKLVAAIAIGNGPSAIIEYAGDEPTFLANLRTNLDSTSDDLLDASRRKGR